MSLHADLTHDPALRSWVASANRASSDFPVQNLLYGRFRRAGSAEPWRIGIAIGDQVLESGPAPGQGGSLLELSTGGQQPITLPNGEQRTFLQDGDTLVLRAFCQQPGAARIDFGDCAGTVLAAPG
jgi:hypothetical protein